MLKEKYDLTEQQINHAYKNLRTRGPQVKVDATPEEYEAFVSAQDHLLAEASERTRKRAQSYFSKEALINRSLLTAASKLEKTAKAQRAYIDGEIRKIAKNCNLPKEQIVEAYRLALQEDAPDIKDHNDVVDTRTRYALLRAGIKSVNDREPSRRVVLYPVQNSNVVKRMGWSSEDGRLEMELQNGIHAFRNVDQDQWERIQRNPDSFLNGDARLSHHQYPTPEQAAKDAYRVWCDNCKVYRLLSRSHKCSDDVARAYRSIVVNMKDEEDPLVAPLPTWGYAWEKRPQKNLEETPEPEALFTMASGDEIVNFEYSWDHEEGTVTAPMSAGRIAPDAPTLIMNENPRCTCEEARRNPDGLCYHISEFQDVVDGYHERFNYNDALDNPSREFPHGMGTLMRAEAKELPTQQLRDVLSVVRQGRPVRLYLESEESALAGALNIEQGNNALTIQPDLFCSGCYSDSCEHVRTLRNTMVQQIEGGYYSPQGRLQALSQTMAPGTPRLSQERNRASVPYSKDVQQYLKDYRSLQERFEAGEDIIPFKEESVTKGMLGTSADDGPGFGVELEFSFSPNGSSPASYDKMRAIADELQERGLSKTSKVFDYGDGSDSLGYNSGWLVEEDASVGGEIVSPILYDTPEDWKNLREVCEVIKKHGGTVSVAAGGHIHVGSPANPDRDTNVMNFIMEHQDSLHRLNTNPNAEEHRSNGYSEPFTNLTSQRALYSLRGRGIPDFERRFAHLGAKGGQTTEFRDPDGSLDPAVIQSQVMMYAALVGRAERGELKPRGERHPVGHNYKRRNLLAGTRKELSDEEVIVSDIAFRHTIDELFDDPDDRQRFVALGVLNEWQAR